MLLSAKDIGKKIISFFPGDYSQKDIGYRLGVGQAAVSRWNNGECYPELQVLAKYIELSGDSWDLLLAGKEKDATLPDSVAAELKKQFEVRGNLLKQVVDFVCGADLSAVTRLSEIIKSLAQKHEEGIPGGSDKKAGNDCA